MKKNKSDRAGNRKIKPPLGRIPEKQLPTHAKAQTRKPRKSRPPTALRNHHKKSQADRAIRKHPSFRKLLEHGESLSILERASLERKILIDLGPKTSVRALARALNLDESTIRDHRCQLDRFELGHRQQEECPAVLTAAPDSVPNGHIYPQGESSTHPILGGEGNGLAPLEPTLNPEPPLPPPSVPEQSSSSLALADLVPIYNEVLYGLQLYKCDRQELESLLNDMKRHLAFQSASNWPFTSRKTVDPYAKPLAEWLVELAGKETAPKMVDVILEALPALRDWSFQRPSRYSTKTYPPVPSNSEELKTFIAGTKLVHEVKKHAHSTGAATQNLAILENRVSETSIGGEASSGSGDNKGMNSAEVRSGDSIDDQLYEELKKIAPSPALATASIKWALYHFSAIEPTYQRRPSAEERKQQDRQQKDEKERLRVERTLQTFSSLRVRKDNQRSSI